LLPQAADLAITITIIAIKNNISNFSIIIIIIIIIIITIIIITTETRW
jgi:t-SNARE complex subunit (syntaxin)